MLLKTFRRREDGSLTLEAAMVMPVFLLFTVFLATMIRISVADMALKQAVSETTEVVATHAYPAVILANAGTSKLDGLIKNNTDEMLDLDQVTSFAGDILAAFNLDVNQYVSSLTATVLNNPVRKGFERANSDGLFDSSRLTVVDVELPAGLEGEGAYFGMTATYDVPIVAPFVNKTITLEQKAYEKIWSGS